MRRTPWLHELRKRHGLKLQYDPCMSTLTPEYMNQPSVLRAIHAPEVRGDGRRWPDTPPGWSYDQSAAGEKQDIAPLFSRFLEDAPHWRIQVPRSISSIYTPPRTRHKPCFPHDSPPPPPCISGCLFWIQVVSGTADAAVPFLGTERWMECLGREVTDDWEAWKLEGQVAGMAKRWGQLSLVTVKGCGHTIPSYCPEAGYAMLEHFLPRSETETMSSY